MKTLALLLFLTFSAQIGWGDSDREWEKRVYSEDRTFEVSASTVQPAIEGWHCIEESATVFLDTTCHVEWNSYYERSAEASKNNWALMAWPPFCEDKNEHHCVREEGYRSDGVVVWRRPEDLDAESRAKQSERYKR